MLSFLEEQTPPAICFLKKKKDPFTPPFERQKNKNEKSKTKTNQPTINPDSWLLLGEKEADTIVSRTPHLWVREATLFYRT